MKVKDMIRMLEDFDKDREVFIADANGFGCNYAYVIDEYTTIAEDHGIRSFYNGEDVKPEECLIILMGDQVGAVWEREELARANDWDEEDEEDEDDFDDEDEEEE